MKPHPVITKAAFALTALLPLMASAAEESKEPKPELLGLDFITFAWVMAIFLVLLTILYKTAWKNVLAGLTAREQRIRGDIAAAEAAKVKAEEALANYNKQLSDAQAKADAIISKARADAEQAGNALKTRAEQDAQARIEKAEQDIERAKNDAIAQIHEYTANLATDVAQKILRRNLNADDQRDLVARSVEQLQSLRN